MTIRVHGEHNNNNNNQEQKCKQTKGDANGIMRERARLEITAC